MEKNCHTCKYVIKDIEFCCPEVLNRRPRNKSKGCKNWKPPDADDWIKDRIAIVEERNRGE